MNASPLPVAQAIAYVFIALMYIAFLCWMAKILIAVSGDDIAEKRANAARDRVLAKLRGRSPFVVPSRNGADGTKEASMADRAKKRAIAHGITAKLKL